MVIGRSDYLVLPLQYKTDFLRPEDAPIAGMWTSVAGVDETLHWVGATATLIVRTLVVSFNL